MNTRLKFAAIAVSLIFCCTVAQAQNPVPSINSFSPPAVYAGGPSFKLTIKGTGFISSTVIYWGSSGAPLTTTYVNATEVTAIVPADYITYPTMAYMYAYNPPPGGGSSQSVPYSVIALDPSLASISPTAVVAGSPTTTLTINGSNFMQGASVLFDNAKAPTTFVNSQELQVQIPKSRLSKPKISQVAVQNPAPGGLSPTLNFNVSYPAQVRTLNLPANDLVWDSKAQLIYASLPSSYGTNGNSIAVVNPLTGKITAYHFVGSEPTQLALSADSSYLYVGLNGNGSVQRMNLPSFALDINVSLGTNEFGQLNTASGLQVSPGNPHTLAVAVGSQSFGGPLEFFTDTSLLPNSITNPAVTSIQFANASTLYGYGNQTLIQVAVNSSGGTLTTQWISALSGNFGGIIYDAGLIYDDFGQVFNPATGELVGSYDAGGCCTSNDLLPESANNATFVAGITPFFGSFGITSYNLSQFTPNAIINLSQFTGTITPTFISWGTEGLAFVINTSQCCGNPEYQTILVQSLMMKSKAK
jgi:trimeric autotransporter adhesin